MKEDGQPYRWVIKRSPRHKDDQNPWTATWAGGLVLRCPTQKRAAEYATWDLKWRREHPEPPVEGRWTPRSSTKT